MKVLCLPEPGNLVIKDLPMPELKEGQAIVKMEMCGICGSDVTAYRGVNPTMRYPINGLGHEGVGIIQEIGENDKGLKPGDRVALEPYVPCNKCHMCAAGRFNNCADLHVCGVHKDGMMSEYFLHQGESIVLCSAPVLLALWLHLPVLITAQPPYWWMCCKSAWITQRSWEYHAPLTPKTEMWRNICGR